MASKLSKGRKLAYVGDGNNMAHSLLFGAAKVGMDVAVASPYGYEVKPEYAALALEDANEAGTKVLLTNDPQEAVEGASAVYTDVWASMGQEAEQQQRLKDFHGFMVDAPSCPTPARTPSSSTASPPTAARRSPPKSATAPRAAFSTKPRTGCTFRRRSCFG